MAVWTQAVSCFGQNSLHAGMGVLSSTFSSVSLRPRWRDFGGRIVNRVAGPLGREANKDTKSLLRHNLRLGEAEGKSCYFVLPGYVQSSPATTAAGQTQKWDLFHI